MISVSQKHTVVGGGGGEQSSVHGCRSRTSLQAPSCPAATQHVWWTLPHRHSEVRASQANQCREKPGPVKSLKILFVMIRLVFAACHEAMGVSSQLLWSLHVTLISGMVILESGFLSSIRKIRVRSSSLISGLHETQDKDTDIFLMRVKIKDTKGIKIIKPECSMHSELGCNNEAINHSAIDYLIYRQQLDNWFIECCFNEKSQLFFDFSFLNVNFFWFLWQLSEYLWFVDKTRLFRKPCSGLGKRRCRELIDLSLK